ncbi:uncharacterized protein LOC127787427 [Diospyros lotus]|uniref:uncharacterized protein LOC127787427 n=1 Tax=Diospyros lotus TaxID=55363 RepID=UPI00224D551C|nr:uncharacterized protein LOC127787427 [Diospyros lotus]
MATAPDKPPKKFPPPCWTQEETLALIDAYRDRWYALRRGYLRTADWDAVAAAVAQRCPGASPAKSSAQCRHKMEKLRQRYRAEKQRSLSFPGRFFSSWFFFENMDSMERGTSLADGSDQNTDDRVESDVIKGLGDRNMVETVFRMKNSKRIDGNSIPNLVPDQRGLDTAGAFHLKDRNSGALGYTAKDCIPNFDSGVLNGYMEDGSDEDLGDDTDFGGGYRIRNPADGQFVHPMLRAKKFGKIHGNFGPNFDPSRDEGGGFCIKPTDQAVEAAGFRAKKLGKPDDGRFKLNSNFDYSDGGFLVNLSGDRYSIPAGFRAKSPVKADGNSCPSLDSRVLNGFFSGWDSGLGKKNCGGGGGGGFKRDRDPIGEMVSAINLLGEGFMKVEKMKMEMVREIEKMRMEMEMKRSELILQSQQQIVDAFVNVLMENKKKKKKKAETGVLPDS